MIKINSLYILLGALIFAIMGCAPKTGESVSQTEAPPQKPITFRSNPPAPGPAPKIQIGKYTTHELDNGLKVIVVENHKLPRVSFQLSLDNDPILEKESAGYISIAGDLLSRGTTKKQRLNSTKPLTLWVQG